MGVYVSSRNNLANLGSFAKLSVTVVSSVIVFEQLLELSFSAVAVR